MEGEKMSKKNGAIEQKQTNTRKKVFFCNVICYGERKLITMATKVMIIIIISISYQLLLSLLGKRKQFVFFPYSSVFYLSVFSPFNKSRILSFVITLIFETCSSIMAQHHLEKSASVKLAVGKFSKHISLPNRFGNPRSREKAEE